jgi:hypothetical protein
MVLAVSTTVNFLYKFRFSFLIYKSFHRFENGSSKCQKEIGKNNPEIRNKLMKKTALILILLTGRFVFCQDVSFSKPGGNFYEEMPNPAKARLNKL